MRNLYFLNDAKFVWLNYKLRIRMKKDREFVEFRKALYESKLKSEDDFEKNLVFLSSGALVLTISFIGTVIPLKSSAHIWILLLSWLFLTITLLISLISQFLSKIYAEKSIDEIDEDLIIETISSNIVKRNKTINCLNFVIIAFFFFGIFFLFIFATINIYKMQKTDGVKTN